MASARSPPPPHGSLRASAETACNLAGFGSDSMLPGGDWLDIYQLTPPNPPISVRRCQKCQSRPSYERVTTFRPSYKRVMAFLIPDSQGQITCYHPPLEPFSDFPSAGFSGGGKGKGAEPLHDGTHDASARAGDRLGASPRPCCPLGSLFNPQHGGEKGALHSKGSVASVQGFPGSGMWV